MNRSPVRGAARLAAILDALPDALLLVDASSTVVNANAAALELFEGESAQRLLGKSLTSLLPSFGRSVATFGAAPKALAAGSGQNGAEAPAATRSRPERQAAARTDGSVFPAEVSSAALPGEEGEVVLLIIRDLTGVLDVEAELRRQQRQIELILRAASEGIVGVDHEGRIVLVNPAGAKILRYRASDLGAQNVHELIAHSTADGTPTLPEQCSLIDSLRSGTKHHAADEVLWRSDGTPVFVDMTTAPVYEGENIIGAVMTFTDNSAAQAAARQSRELAQLLEQQLQRPLGAALNQLQEATEYGIGEIGPGLRQALISVTAELAQANTIVEDLVDYQKLVIGDTQYAPEQVSLAGVIDAAVSAASELAETMGVDIVAHTPDIEVSLDPELFGKLLGHLLTDMVSATPIGGKILLATTRRESVLRIELRGPHTGGNATHLSIAKAIAARHSGTVTTHRIAGKGNTHVIELPWDGSGVDPSVAIVEAKTARRPVALPVAEKRPVPPPPPPAPPAPKVAERLAPQPVTYDEPAAEQANGPTNGTANGHLSDEPAYGSRASGRDLSDLGGPVRTTLVNGRAAVPAQSRVSAAARALSIDPADLRPSKPLPTSDVWSRTGRSESGDQSGEGSGSGSSGTGSTRIAGAGRRRFATEEVPTRSAAAPVAEPVTPAAPAEPNWTAEPAWPEEPAWIVESVQTPEPVQATQPRPSMQPVRAPEPVQSMQPIDTGLSRRTLLEPFEPARPAAERERQSELPDLVDQEEPEDQARPATPSAAAPRLLLWPEPDPTTTALLTEQGYAAVPLASHEELPGLLGTRTGSPRPAAVFVDPIAAPITRRGLRALHGAAVGAGLPMLVTAGIGAAPLGTAPGPDPALLLQALTPAAAVLPRVMLVEERPDMAAALTRSLERQGMQVLHAATDSESVAAAVRGAPDVVIMDLMQIRRRRVGIVEWLRDQRRLALTPIVVYTTLDIDMADLPSLRTGAWSLYLAERAVDSLAGARIVDLLSKIAAVQ